MHVDSPLSTGSSSLADAPESGKAHEAAAPRRRPAAPPQRVSIFAAFVSLLAVTGAVLLGIYGQPIDAHRSRLLLAAPEEIAAWVAAEHDRSETEPGYIQDKLLVLSREALESRLGGPSPLRARLFGAMEQSGYHFLGGGPSGLPVDWAGSHLAFISGMPQGSGEAPSELSLMSVVILPNAGQFGEWADESGVMVELRDLPARGSGRLRNVHVLSDGMSIYFLTGGGPGALSQVMQAWIEGPADDSTGSGNAVTE